MALRHIHIHYLWVIVVSSTGTLFACSLSTYAFGVFLRPLAQEFGWETGALSLAPSISSVVAGVSSIVTGRLSDKYGPRILLTLSGIMLGSGLLLMSQVSTLGQVYIFWGLFIGLAIGCSMVPLLSTIPKWFAQKKGTVVGIVVTGLGLGGIAAPLIAQLLISAYGWQTSFLILGVIAWAIMIPLSQYIRQSPAMIKREPYGNYEASEVKTMDNPGQELPLTLALRTLPFWVFATIYFLWSLCEEAIIVHIVPHAKDSGIPDIIAAGVLSLMVGISIVGRVSIGVISDKLGSKRALGLCLLLATVAMWWLLFVHEIWAFYLWAILFGLAFGGLVSLYILVPFELFGTKSLGAILGFLMFSGTISWAMGPPLAGYIFDMTGSYYLALLILAAVCTTATMLVLVLLRHTVKASEKGIV